MARDTDSSWQSQSDSFEDHWGYQKHRTLGVRKATQRMKRMAGHKPTAAKLTGHCCLGFPRCVGSFWSEFPKPAPKGSLRCLHCPLWWYPRRCRVWPDWPWTHRGAHAKRSLEHQGRIQTVAWGAQNLKISHKTEYRRMFLKADRYHKCYRIWSICMVF